MWPDRVSNPGPLTYESGALPIALRGPARTEVTDGWMHGMMWRKWIHGENYIPQPLAGDNSQ